MMWEEFSFVMASSYRIKILLSLKEGPKTPTEIARETKLHKGNISKVLGQLREKDLVECITPTRRKARFYKLTKKGEYVADKIKMRLTSDN